jgi:hypothetical protein
METRMEPWMRKFAVSAAVLAIASASTWSAVAQGKTESPQASSPREVAGRDPLADQEIGKRFNVSPESLPAPKSGPVVSNAPLVLPYEGQTPRVPEGFSVTPLRPAWRIRGGCSCCPTGT